MSSIYALFAAFLFALSMPLGKLLLGHLAPLELSAFCYLGCALGLFGWRLIAGPSAAAERFGRKDFKWVAAFTLFGGVAAPLLLFEGLNLSHSSQASLMLNFELVFTSLIAVVFFRERGGWRLWAAVALITAGAFSLGFDRGVPGTGRGLLLVGLASFAWALDNNFTARVSAKDPLTLAAIKGLAGGLVNLALALAVYGRAAPAAPAVLALALGAVSYGASLVFLILAMRALGAARAGAFFGVYPFMGALAGLLFLGETLSAGLIAAFVFTAAGVALLTGERHSHRHFHPALEHEHAHLHDAHHNHPHGAANPLPWHSHSHIHSPLFHEHGHIHDEHHQASAEELKS
ncbi:MAG: EamA family transporter [Elusimicrobia bacterium]|nr:EamA family transporter [Elusimicrobiota bacterium]